ncbi:MAG: SIMPL domain-containing protein [Anaerolineae bacterium]|nr:SIMPL domain-containing protein [Anaerolineae bacterium]
MRTRSFEIVAIALVLVFAFASWTRAEPVARQNDRSIAVTGEAEVRVVPDEVILTVGVETHDRDLELAKRQNDVRVEQVIATAQAYGIEMKHIQTDHVSIEPRYHDSYEKQDFVGFFVRKNVVVTLRDISKFEDLLAGLLDNGVNYVHGIQFRTTDLREHRDRARDLAIKAAKEKAVALAGALDQKVGEPLAIQEESSGWYSGYGAWWGLSWGGGMTQNVIQNAGDNGFAGEGSIAPGQISINARVSVSFELE